MWWLYETSKAAPLCIQAETQGCAENIVMGNGKIQVAMKGTSPYATPRRIRAVVSSRHIIFDTVPKRPNSGFVEM